MKIVKICFIFLVLLTFSSCELLNILLFEETPQEKRGSIGVLTRDNFDTYTSYSSNEITRENCETDGEGDLFLIKYNKNNFDINGTSTGYVTNASRSIQTDASLSEISGETSKFNRIDFRYSDDFLTENIYNNRSVDIINENINQNYSVGSNKSFYIIPNLSNQKNYKLVNAELKYVSEYSYIWVVTDSNYKSSANLVNLTNKDYKKLGDMFDIIYPSKQKFLELLIILQ